MGPFSLPCLYFLDPDSVQNTASRTLLQILSNSVTHAPGS